MKTLKYLIILELKLFKYLFYDMIPEVYDNIKWYKHDFESKLDYYCFKPIIYLTLLVISLLDFEVMLYRIVFILGAMKGGYTQWRNMQVKSRSGGL